MIPFRRRPAAPSAIHVLDEHVANKIAAGEVIERPASVVKELVENALDAGATRIEIELKAGGKEYIRVTDDGAGIAPEQLATAFERHATSKIAGADDLFAVGTLGFRGEALPSIASVAEVDMRSRPKGAAAGAALQVEGGRVGRVEPAGMPPGTTVVVRRLFYNTPARYKFLRSDGAERRRIMDVVARQAFAWPDVAWRLVADGRELLATPGDGQLTTVVRALYGGRAAAAVVPVNFEQDGLQVDGLVGKPDVVHGNRDRMSVFLNRRWIQSPSLLHAVLKGYETLLPPRRFPLAVLHLTVDPAAVDVNVHPAKSEVRFQDDGAVYRTVMRAVRYGLLEANLIGGLGPGMLTDVGTPPAAGDVGSTDATGPLARERSATDGFAAGLTEAPGGPAAAPPGTAGQGEVPGGGAETGLSDTIGAEGGLLARTKKPSFGGAFASPLEGPGTVPGPARRTRSKPHGQTLHAAMYEAAWREAAAAEERLDLAGASDDARARLRDMVVLGQLQRTFILGETGSGLWIVDQHVAHERVLYERYLAEGAEADGVQRLLVPVVVTLSPERVGLVEQFEDELARLGFQLEPFGAAAYAVRGVPVALVGTRSEARLADLLETILDACVTEGRWDDHEAAAALACKAAVKAGDALTKEQMERLLRQLAETHNPFACPHGRPIVVEVGRFDLERRFGRR